MNFTIDVLDESEKIIFALRSLYSRYGFERYRMGKFEEYDLYSRNKDFLVSDSVITFMDTNGRLMALKPDVTLSIIKNNKLKPGETRKLYYNENVYRVAKGSNSFREIMQTGLECFGSVDASCIRDVLLLAADSLQTIHDAFILEISDLEILSSFVTDPSVPEPAQKRILKCFGEKNLHGIITICDEYGLPESYKEGLKSLLTLYGSPDYVIPSLQELCKEKGLNEEVERLIEGISVFQGTPYQDHVVLDFSAVSDMNYYNGIIFRGFLSGIPDSVLSGGQYDRLMQKMGRNAKAIGFAVYLDKLQGILEKGNQETC